MLVQEASDGLDQTVSYFSKKFLKYEKKFSVVKKETLGLVLALDHFDVYLFSFSVVEKETLGLVLALDHFDVFLFSFSVVEKETLGLVLALDHFDVFLFSTPINIKVYTDPS